MSYAGLFQATLYYEDKIAFYLAIVVAIVAAIVATSSNSSN
jgi:hypothetical protein